MFKKIPKQSRNIFWRPTLTEYIQLSFRVRWQMDANYIYISTIHIKTFMPIYKYNPHQEKEERDI